MKIDTHYLTLTETQLFEEQFEKTYAGSKDTVDLLCTIAELRELCVKWNLIDETPYGGWKIRD